MSTPTQISSPQETKGLQNKEVQRVIESIQKSLEEKITQMSQIRFVAETTSSGLYRSSYIQNVCNSFLDQFNALACCYLKFENGDKASWRLEHWASRKNVMKPANDCIKEDAEGILGWVNMFRKPTYRAELNGDPFAEFLGGEIFVESAAVFFPLISGGSVVGILALIEPLFNISQENINPHIGVLCSLINTGFQNFFMYRDLRISEDEYRDLFENSSDMVAVVKTDGQIKDCNRAFLETLEVAGDMRGWDIFAFIAEKSSREFAEYWCSLKKGKAVSNKLIFLTDGSGGIVECDFAGNARLTAEGKVELLRLYFHDETKRREAERQRMELESELRTSHQQHLSQIGFYVSGIVHNLRNPVQIITGYIDMLRTKGYDVPELEKMKNGAKNMVDIIENILIKVKKESSVEEAEVNLNDLLKCELEFLNANQFFKHEIKKEFEFSEELPPVRGLYGDFSQAIMNLITNALDAMNDSPRKELRIETWFEKEKDTVCISISDTGPGIPLDLQDKIFQPFFSTKSSDVNGKHGILSGSGLGLPNALSLIKHYGGDIRLSSEAGVGTTFTISLPLKI